MKRVTYVEIDIDYCGLSYGQTTGVGTCPAVLGVDSAAKCFNSISTCAVRASFLNTPVTLRFAVQTDYLPRDIDALPMILSDNDISFTAAVLNPGKDIGQRAQLDVTFVDRPHTDTGPGFDKYLSDRSYTPYNQGTFWGKFRARQRYMQGRAIRLIRGELGQALADMDTRHFVIESFNGPGEDGRFRITAYDLMAKLMGDRAQAPLPSRGALNADITSGATTAVLSPAGVGNAYYPASGKVNISNEVMLFTRSADTLTITRAQNNTTAVAHKAGDRVQIVLSYVAQDVADILKDLWTNYAGMPSGYIPIADWQAETATYLRQVYTADITEPTGVDTLSNELIQQATLNTWWDDKDQKNRLRVLRTIQTDAAVFGEDKWMKGTLKIKEQPDKRVSRVMVYYAQINPLLALDLESNYRSAVLVIDPQTETDYGSSSLLKVFSRWIPAGGKAGAERIANILLGRFKIPPRRFNFSLYPSNPPAAVPGTGYKLEARFLQDQFGAGTPVPIQINRFTPGAAAHPIEAEEALFASIDTSDLTNHPITFDANINNVVLSDVFFSNYGTPSDGDICKVRIDTGVAIGSEATSSPAFSLGTWPTKTITGNRTTGSPTLTSIADTTGLAIGQRVFGTGIPAGAKILSIVTNTSITLDANATSGTSTSTTLTIHTVLISIENNGVIAGAGGNGGAGATGNGDHVALSGRSGGLGLYARYAFDFDNADGIVGGGGGGGGGAGCRTDDRDRGGSGGGGAGQVAGRGTNARGGGGERSGDGTLLTGTQGSRSYYNTGGIGDPGYHSARGGHGGDLGVNGGRGATTNRDSTAVGGDGGTAGKAIDGVSYIKSIAAGDVRGAQVN